MFRRYTVQFAKEIIDFIAVYEKNLQDRYEGMPIGTMAKLEAMSRYHTEELNNILKNSYDLKEDIAFVYITPHHGIYVTVGLCE